jgi:hypothetical protein
MPHNGQRLILFVVQLPCSIGIIRGIIHMCKLIPKRWQLACIAIVDFPGFSRRLLASKNSHWAISMFIALSPRAMKVPNRQDNDIVRKIMSLKPI